MNEIIDDEELVDMFGPGGAEEVKEYYNEAAESILREEEKIAHDNAREIEDYGHYE